MQPCVHTIWMVAGYIISSELQLFNCLPKQKQKTQLAVSHCPLVYFQATVPALVKIHFAFQTFFKIS